MSTRLKNGLYTLALLVLVFIVWKVRDVDSSESLIKQQFTGQTMGTTYSITFFGREDIRVKSEVDSILLQLNEAVSTYIAGSEISRFNRSDSLSFSSDWFYPLLRISAEIYEVTGGAFDPTVMPLVNGWGFGPEEAQFPDSTAVDSLLQFTGFDKLRFSEDGVGKLDYRVQLDFSAIAKGYGVDLISNYLLDKGHLNHYVEIGGEVIGRGKNLENERDWVTGILNPESGRDEIAYFATIESEGAIATSGNYFNYLVRDGVRYSHTISPFTGYPVEHEILSATVLTDDCASADALATSFMVMGHRDAIELIEDRPDIDALLLYSGEDGRVDYYLSTGIEHKVRIVK